MFNEFKSKYLGQTVDVDGAFGGQCVDLFNAWNRDYNNCYINCQPTGYARSIAENKANNGILNYFNETAVNNMIEGTVVVYGKCNFAPEGHVCFFVKDNGDGTYQALQQNAGGRQYVTIDSNPYSGIIGAFIPKQVQEEFSRKLEEQKRDETASQQTTAQKLYLPASAESWRIYDLNVAPVRGNEKGFLKPSKFGGLEYDILGWSQNDVAIIQTRDFGQVQIYVASNTGATIK